MNLTQKRSSCWVFKDDGGIKRFERGYFDEKVYHPIPMRIEFRFHFCGVQVRHAKQHERNHHRDSGSKHDCTYHGAHYHQSIK